LTKQARRDAEMTAKFLSDGAMHTSADDITSANHDGQCWHRQEDGK